MTSQIYYHPKYGALPLVIHPERPWRVVAYYGGTAVYEADLVEEPKPKKNTRSTALKENETENESFS